MNILMCLDFTGTLIFDISEIRQLIFLGEYTKIL